MGFGTANHFQKPMTILPAMQSPQLTGGYSLPRLPHWRWLFFGGGIIVSSGLFALQRERKVKSH
jgi:hypothetical protein